jgi:hypothetical protein
MMAQPRYAKNIVTDTREYTPEEIARIKKAMKDGPIKSTIELLRLLWMDDEKVKNANFYMECVWLWGGKTTSGTTEEPHVHPFPEVIGFISSDPDNPGDLDARMEIILGDETHFLTKSCLVYIPPGMKHCPLTFREVNRPVFFFTLAPISRYGRRSEKMSAKEAAKIEIPKFRAPRKDANGSRYARYIITSPKSHTPRRMRRNPPPPPPKAKASHIVSLDSEVIPGAFYADFVWIWSGDMTMAPASHAHDWDEMIGLVGGCGKDNPRFIDGDLTIAIDNKAYPIKQSSLVYIPPGVEHCPIEFKNIRQPVLCFTIGNSRKWTQQKKQKAKAKK